MTVRTLLLENALTSCMAVLVGTLTMKVRLDCILHILFERSGARMVTGSQTISWMNTTGLSAAYQRLLTAVVDGLGAMDLRAQGKPIGRVRAGCGSLLISKTRSLNFSLFIEDQTDF